MPNKNYLDRLPPDLKKSGDHTRGEIEIVDPDSNAPWHQPIGIESGDFKCGISIAALFLFQMEPAKKKT